MTVTINGTSGVTTPGVANTGNETITGNLAVTGTATAASLQVGGVTTNVYPVVTGTSQASTSGTAIDFTGIPSWVKRITVLLNGVSTGGTTDLLVQIGAGSVVTTGYVSGSGRSSGASAAGSSSTVGFNIYDNSGASVISGAMTITLFGSNTWIASHSMGYGAGGGIMGGGNLTLGGTLDRVRITSVTPDAFDLGSINILYE